MEHDRNLAVSTAAQQGVHVRSVWSHNVDQEFALIRSAALRHRIVGMDTEYPGILFKSSCHPYAMTPDQHYGLLKANVDALNVVQVGLTLSDPWGRLPDLGDSTGTGYVWEFNIRGFHPRRDPHAKESVELLRKQGMDFDVLERDGIEPRRFGELMIFSGLLLDGSTITWTTFQGVYDFAFLIKILTAGQGLPPSLGGFVNLVRCYFGDMVFDVKHLMRYCNGLYGGLEKVARDLKVDRVVGKGHQAGSDSLLTLQVFKRVMEKYFADGGVEQYAGRLFGLTA